MLNRNELNGSLAVAIGAGFWGLFWIPLRYLDSLGIQGLWAVGLSMFSGLLVALPVAWRRSLAVEVNWLWVIVLGCGIGASTVLYFVGVIISDVIRVIFLFYLLPLWATLASWLLFGQTISAMRLLAIGVAGAGLWLLLGGGGWPIPQNIGDVMGLAAGVLWGVSLALIKEKAEIDPFANTASTFCFAFIFSIASALIVAGLGIAPKVIFPEFSLVLAALPAALAFGILALWPSMIGQLWGARLIPAPRAALFTMSEILVATLSAWILIGTEMTSISLVGGMLIVGAAILDIYAEFAE